MPITLRLKQGPRLHKLPTGQHLLLDALWRKHGGLRKAAKLLKVPEYQLNVWRKRGKVPVKHALKIAPILKVPKYALNFIEVCQLLGHLDINSKANWKAVVECCDLPESDVKKILRAKSPKL